MKTNISDATNRTLELLAAAFAGGILTVLFGALLKYVIYEY